MASAEFRAAVGLSEVASSKWVAADVLDRFTMWLDLHDRFVSRGCLNNNWEPNETNYFISRLRPGDVVLDIGANIGWFSLVAAKHIGKTGRVHAFEPSPETARMLKRTIATNDLQAIVQVHEFALSDRWEELRLVWSKGTDNPGGSFLAGPAEDHKQGFDSARVRAGLLDDILPDIAPDIVKIDVEGAEPHALRGARNALARKKPPILSELLPAQLQSVSGTTSAQYIEQMRELGYSCYLLEDSKPTRKLTDFPTNFPGQIATIVFEYSGPAK
jgi:FkbM family methyltransferase